MLFISGQADETSIETAHVQFHNAVYDVLRSITAEKLAHRLSDFDAAARRAQKYFAKVWSEKGPIGHVYESLYREQASLMSQRALRRIANSHGTLLLPREWIVERPAALISVVTDHLELIEEAHGATLLIQHIRTGRLPSKPPDDPLYGLYYALATEHFPDARRRVQVLYLATDEIIEIELTPRMVNNRLKHYDDAIASILAGEFSPTVSDHMCPQCPHFFVCPKAEDDGTRQQ